MQRYSEDEIITISYCNYLHYLGGNINQLSKSQLLFKDLICKFNFKILNKELVDIDIFLNTTLKDLIGRYYIDNKTIDDLSYLHSFFSQFFFKYLNLFPSDKYMPAFIDYKPIIKLYNLEVKVNLDLILIQQNKDAFYHLICFTKDLSDFNLKNNPFNYLKLKILKKIYEKRKRRVEPVKVNFLYIPEPTFRNRNQRDYRLKHKLVDLTYYNEIEINNYENCFKNFTLKEPTPRFFCNEKNCIKRKECLNANIR